MTAAIETDDLTKRYGSGEDRVLAVDGLDLTVERGEVFGVLGPNGAGKSTTIDMLLDYVRPTAGSATLLGYDAQADAEAITRHVGVLPEGLGLYERLTGRRHLELAIEWSGAADATGEAGADVDRLLDRVGLDRSDAKRRVAGYSKGMQRRLGLAMALVGDPELLILDEPSAGLDPNGIRRLRELVRAEAQRGTTVFFSSHVLGQVEAVCDRVGILADGELVAEDSVAGLRRAVGAGSELQVRVGGSVDVDLTALHGVESVERAAGILRVSTAESRAKAAVVARLQNAGVDVIDIDSAEVSLEDVFAAYTRGADAPDGGADQRSVGSDGPDGDPAAAGEDSTGRSEVTAR